MKPILFNTDMVRAILDGRKTMTRRVIKPKFKPEEAGWNIVTNKHTGEFCYCQYYDEYEESTRRLNPPYFPGDILYVRETWNVVTTGNHTVGYWYKADYKDENPDDKWRPSIHMPKEAARIFLRVTDVREERLQEMTVRDLIAEGFASLADIPYSASERFDEFKTLWDSTIKTADLDRYGWDANPCVWVIEFERCEKPQENKP